jgi:hypothetical protein
MPDAVRFLLTELQNDRAPIDGMPAIPADMMPLGQVDLHPAVNTIPSLAAGKREPGFLMGFGGAR